MTDKPVTVGIDKDEWFPVYSILSPDESYTETRTIPAALRDRCQKAFEEFEAVQRELEAIFDRAAQS